MHEYDTAFRVTLQDVDVALRALIGEPIARWFNVELPAVRHTRVDMPGETEGGELIHIELQTTNDPAMLFGWPKTACRLPAMAALSAAVPRLRRRA